MSDQGAKRGAPGAERRLDERVATQVRVRLKYPDVETFLERYATNISHGGIFIQTQRTKPAGTLIRFEFQLQDASPVIRGEGRVSWVVPYDPAHAERAYGMGVKFTRLDGRSKTLIDRVVAQKLKRGEPDDASAPPSPEVAELGPVRDVSPPEATAAAGRTPPRSSPVLPPSGGGSAPPEASPTPLATRAASPGEEHRRGNGRPTEEEIAQLLATPLAVEIGALVEKVLGKPKIEPAAADELLAALEREVGPVASKRPPPQRDPTPAARSPVWPPAPTIPAPSERQSRQPAHRTATPAVVRRATPAAVPVTTPPRSTPDELRSPGAPGREPTPTPVDDPTEAVVAPPASGAEPDSGLATAPTPADQAVESPPAPAAMEPPAAPETAAEPVRHESRLDRIFEEAAPDGSFELDLDGLGAAEDTGLDIVPAPPEPPARRMSTQSRSSSHRAPPETIPTARSVPLAHGSVAALQEPASEATDPALAIPSTERDMPLASTAESRPSGEDSGPSGQDSGPSGQDSAWDQITVVPDGDEPQALPRRQPLAGDREPLGVTPEEPSAARLRSPQALDPAIHVAEGDDPAFSMDDAPLIEEGEGGLAERTVIGGSVFDFLSGTAKARVDEALARSRPDRSLEVTATHPPLEVPDADGSPDAMFGVEVELPPDAGAQQGMPILDEPLVDDFGLPPGGGEAPGEVAAAAPAEPIIDENAPTGEPMPAEAGFEADLADIEIGLEPTAAQEALVEDIANEATTAAPALGDAFVFAQTIQAEALAGEAFEPTLAREGFTDFEVDGPPVHEPSLPVPAALEEGTLREAVLPGEAEMPEEATPVSPTDPTSGAEAPKKGFFRKFFGNK